MAEKQKKDIVIWLDKKSGVLKKEDIPNIVEAVKRSLEIYIGGEKRGRKKIRDAEYMRGYHCGWGRVEREFKGIPIGMRNYEQTVNYHEGFLCGMEAAARHYKRLAENNRELDKTYNMSDEELDGYLAEVEDEEIDTEALLERKKEADAVEIPPAVRTWEEY